MSKSNASFRMSLRPDVTVTLAEPPHKNPLGFRHGGKGGRLTIGTTGIILEPGEEAICVPVPTTEAPVGCGGHWKWVHIDVDGNPIP